MQVSIYMVCLLGPAVGALGHHVPVPVLNAVQPGAGVGLLDETALLDMSAGKVSM